MSSIETKHFRVSCCLQRRSELFVLADGAFEIRFQQNFPFSFSFFFPLPYSNNFKLLDILYNNFLMAVSSVWDPFTNIISSLISLPFDISENLSCLNLIRHKPSSQLVLRTPQWHLVIIHMFIVCAFLIFYMNYMESQICHSAVVRP